MKTNLHSEPSIQSETYFPDPPHTPNHWTVPTQDGFQLFVALPGCSRDQIHIELTEHRLTLRAKRPAPFPQHPDLRLLHRESRAGDFLLQGNLPEDVDADAISASLQDGILTLTVPRRASRSRSVPVT